jgi:hypothetical protein
VNKTSLAANSDNVSGFFKFPIHFQIQPRNQPRLSPTWMIFYPKRAEMEGLGVKMLVCGGELLPARGEMPVGFPNVTVLFPVCL